MVLENKIFQVFPHFQPIETLDPRGGASLDHRGMVGMVYVGDNKTSYIPCVPHGFREEDFLTFSHYKSIETLDPQDRASLDPRAMVKEVHHKIQKLILNESADDNKT